MSILSKTLYKKYGVIISKAEDAYFDFIFENTSSVEKSLIEFSKNCETRYFNKKRIKEISNIILKEEIGRDFKSSVAPDGKGPAGNIVDAQLVADKEGLYIEDTVDTMSGKEVVYLEDEDKKNMYKEMEEDYIHVFTRNMKNKYINK